MGRRMRKPQEGGAGETEGLEKRERGAWSVERGISCAWGNVGCRACRKTVSGLALKAAIGRGERKFILHAQTVR